MKKKIFVFVLAAALINFFPANAAPPSQSKEFNGHHYLLVDKSMTWSEAKDYCEKNGGHLATITSDEENKFIAELVKNNSKKDFYMVGGKKNDSGEWIWVTGENFSYSNWAKGEPNNLNGNENHLMVYKNSGKPHINVGEWNDTDGEGLGGIHSPQEGSDAFGFICEWEF